MATALLLRVAKLTLWLLRILFLSRHALALENLALRQQLAALKDRRQRPRLDGIDRAFWVGLRQVWAGWLDSLLIVKPDTVVSWHRRGFRLYWRLLSRGRPRIEPHLRKLIRGMVRDNPTWGAPRIHGELLKLGFDVSEATVSRYMPKVRRRRPDAAKQWLAFLRNHRDLLTSMDLFTVPTATFRVLYGFFIIHHSRREILHFNATEYPTAQWIIQQLRDAFPDDATLPRYWIFDRDSTFSLEVVRTIKTFGMKPIRTAYKSPWQNGVAERWIASLRREMLNHVVVVSSRHLCRLVLAFAAYYHEDRTHLGLDKDTPHRRPIERHENSANRVVAFPRLGGLHHRYTWRSAA
jgi:transposase InsO family protein